MKKTTLQDISILDTEKIIAYLFGKKLSIYEKTNHFPYIPDKMENINRGHFARRIHIGAVFETYGGKETKMYPITLEWVISTKRDQWLESEELVQELRKKIIKVIGNNAEIFIEKYKHRLNQYAWNCFKNNGIKDFVISTGSGYHKVFRFNFKDIEDLKEKFF